MKLLEESKPREKHYERQEIEKTVFYEKFE